ncbi:MAG: integrase arm-type DNA-binding domain-containing protein [Hyphomicrobiales bacterium]|nr:integrase arm-type DNA-binding domain-containing protein [Hyphomicrobiales bacterium]
MSKVLTVKSIETYKPDPQRRLEIPDGAISGLYFVIQPSGAKSWAVRYRAPATRKPAKFTLGRFPILGLADARQLARDALTLVSQGGNPATSKRAAATPSDRNLVSAIAADFLKRHASKNRTANESQRVFDREIFPAWGKKNIQEVTRRDVINLLDGIVDRGSPVMANRTLAAVRKFFNWAVSRDIVGMSPAAGVRPPAVERSRERILTDQEIRTFWKATDADPVFGPIFRMLLLTGQRRSEVGQMRDTEVVGTEWTIPADRAKNGKEHRVHLSPEVMAILNSVKRVAGSTGIVFSTNGKTPVSGYSRAKIRLDKAMWTPGRGTSFDQATQARSNFTLHDLRRTAASGMARIGVNLPVIERVLNHISGSFGGVAGVYQRHSFETEMALALDAWSSFVLNLVNEKSAADVVPIREAKH